MKLITHILALLLLAGATNAQNPKIAKAEALIAAGKPEKALSGLIKAYNKAADEEIGLKIFDLYTAQRRVADARDWAETLNLTGSDSLPYVLRHIDLLLLDRRYHDALNRSLAYALGDLASEEIRQKAYICENLIRAELRSVLYKLEPMPFNAYTDEISITNYRRQYVMSSNRVTEMADGSSNQDYFDLFMLQKDYNQWRYPFFLLKDRDPKRNLTTLSYSADGNYVYYTASNYLSEKQRKKQPDALPDFRIYQAVSMGNEWREVELLPHQQEGFRYKDPTIHPKGELLVFSSDQAGNGDFDLYQMARDGDTWRSPVPLGKAVNSAYNETMPYFDEDGNLYFSSDAPTGFGGYDIYRTRQDRRQWLLPELLPPPINSAYDDVSYARNTGRSGGFFASNRPGGAGGFDIYGFGEMSYQLGVTVLDAASGAVIELAEISLMRDGIELERRVTNTEGLALFTIGKSVEYTVVVEKDGYLESTSPVPAKPSDNQPLVYANVRLKADPDYTPVDGDGQFNNQNFVRVTCYIKDGEGSPMAGQSLRLINTSSNRMKLLTADESGAFSQSLYFGNQYRIEVDWNGGKFVQAFNIDAWKGKSEASVTFTIGNQ